MRSSRALAVLVDPGSLGQIPESSRVLPVSPRVRATPDRLMAHRPEDILTEADLHRIESQAREVAEDWWKATSPGVFLWRNLNVAACFTHDLRFVARDALKTSRILKAAIERSGAESLITDVPAIRDVFPAYPYMVSVGSILDVFARSYGLHLEKLDPGKAPPRVSRRRGILKAYGTVAARQAIPQLRTGRSLVGIGPFPESFAPIARQWSKGNGSVVVASSIRTPLRTRASVGLYFAPLEAFLSRNDQAEMQAFITAAVDSTPTTLPSPLGREPSLGLGGVF